MVGKLLAVLSLVVVATSLPAVGKMRGPSTPEERAQALEYAQSLEEHPLAKDSLEKRIWLTEWLVEIPDVTVNVCPKELKALKSLDKVNDTYSNQLRMQVLYSQAAFQLQHPEEKNTVAIQAAGLAGTLRAYRAIQQFDPSAKYPLLDNLMSLEKQGKLEKYVQKQNKCVKS
jgi:hypothetical protein